MIKPLHTLPFLAFLLVSIAACNTAGRGIFAKKTAREKYEDRIEKIESPAVMAWKKMGEKALLNPLSVPAPYAETGIFSGDSSDANAFLFSAGAGQKIVVSATRADAATFTSFLELWDASNPGSPKLLRAADTMLNSIEYAAAEGGKFIVRLQPKLASRGKYNLKIALAPILGFPIPNTIKSSIGSLWGDARDAGARKHEGIDIFAKKGSPVVAVTDGVVRRTGDGGIGGKVIWFNPAGENFSVYYAHLDTQYVSGGQRVSKGEVMGTVGNTGNAQFTPAHLHFGVYTASGAVNPLGFVQAVTPPALAPSIKNLDVWYKTSSKLKLYASPGKKGQPIAATGSRVKTVSVGKDFYKVLLQNGEKAYVSINDLTEKMKM